MRTDSLSVSAAVSKATFPTGLSFNETKRKQGCIMLYVEYTSATNDCLVVESSADWFYNQAVKSALHKLSFT